MSMLTYTGKTILSKERVDVMRRKTKRATQEEIQAFENSMHRRTDDADGSCSQGDPCLCNFTWLDDTALSALPYDLLLKTAAQYRDIIIGLLEKK